MQVSHKDSTTDILCKLRHESQHSQQREDREGHKGGGSSILIPISEKQKTLTMDDDKNTTVSFSSSQWRWKSRNNGALGDGRKNAQGDGEEGR